MDPGTSARGRLGFSLISVPPLGLVERDTRPSGRCACGAELRLSRGGNRDEYTAWLLRQCERNDVGSRGHRDVLFAGSQVRHG